MFRTVSMGQLCHGKAWSGRPRFVWVVQFRLGSIMVGLDAACFVQVRQSRHG